LVSTPSVADGQDQIAQHEFYLQMFYGTSSPFYQDLNIFRCDSASYRPGDQGCVFHAVILFFNGLSLSGSAKEVAQHVFDALYHPDRTVPTVPGTKRMGGAPQGIPLRYADPYDKQADARARRAVAAACNQYFPHRTKLQQCDEYPFRSTVQAPGGGGDYAVRAINGRQNSAGGGYLVAFYNSNRLLKDDQFYVVIRP
jgi:hypothetical protein